MRYRFYKKQHIRKQKEFSDILNKKDKTSLKTVVLYKCKNNLDISRLGISISRKVANAPKRNRIKRLLREWFRLNSSLFKDNYDIIIIARTDFSGQKLEYISRELNKICQNF